MPTSATPPDFTQTSRILSSLFQAINTKESASIDQSDSRAKPQSLSATKSSTFDQSDCPDHMERVLNFTQCKTEILAGEVTAIAAGTSHTAFINSKGIKN